MIATGISGPSLIKRNFDSCMSDADYIVKLHETQDEPEVATEEVSSEPLPPSPQPEAMPPPSPKPVDSEPKAITIEDRFQKLKELRQKDLITEEEYQKARKRS